MAEEPTLPSLASLPAVSWDERNKTIRTKKRVRLDGNDAPLVISTSSDPAFFSSDDDPSIENYTRVRRKRRLVGSWYEQQPAPSSDSCFDDALPPPKPNRKFMRHFDSGVWMADASDEVPCDDDVTDHISPPYPPKARLPQLCREGPKLSEAEAAARKVIHLCIDEGLESVDLSGLDLMSISNETIAPLSTLSPIPLVAQDVPFEPKDPSIKLFLANNQLIKVPGAIFDLEDLTLLSLRGNRLEFLPDSVGNLRNLRELNISQNRLQYLPSTLLDLLGPGSKLSALSIQLNDFLQLDESLSQAARDHDDAIDPTQISNISAYFVARSAVRTPMLERRNLNPKDGAWQLPTSRSGSQRLEAFGSTDSSRSRIPSLMELALRKCYQSSMLSDLPGLFPDDSLEHLRALLETAIEQKETGGIHCSICGNLLVTPATQWIEWWGIKHGSSTRPQLPRLHDPDVVPFLNMGCSPACSPRDIKPGTTLEELRGVEADGS